jgi:SAM-dependent methyltransferase
MAATHCQIVLVKPEGNVHAQAFQEVAETLLCALQHMEVPARITTNEVDGAAVNILLGWHLLGEEALAHLPEQTVLYNLEQLDEKNRPMLTKLLTLGLRFEVWDYSRRNMEILRGEGFKGTLNHAPVGFVDELFRIQKSPEQDIDVLFYGSVNERRLRILEALKAQGLKVEAVFGVYGAERDALIARAKVVLNVHYYDSSIFEIVRVSYLLANRKAVVAECHPGTEIEPELREAVRAVPYEGLVEACLDLVRDDGARAALEARGHAIFSVLREEAILGAILGGESAPAETIPLVLPRRLNIGSGKDWREDCLNVDYNDYWRPDAVLDLNLPLDHVLARPTERFGPVRLEKGYFREIIANDVLEHIPDLTTAMRTCLDLLAEGGRFRIKVPYDLSYGAWQDPTHVRAFNERSWLYYTDWFWYLGWQDARFEMEALSYVPSPLGNDLLSHGQSLEDILRQPRAVDDMVVVLRKRPLTPEEQAAVGTYLARPTTRTVSGKTTTPVPAPAFGETSRPPVASESAPPPPPAAGEGAASGGSYYNGLNQHLLRVVPDTAMEILEVGCAEGRLGAALKELRPGRRVYGIEREAEVAARAADRLDRVYTMDLERDLVGIAAASLDAILFGDVLEHLLDPSAVLKGMAPLLRPDGRIYCCIPNVQHHSVVTPLIRGEFQYQKAGLLDATRLRFFTWASFTRLLLDAGYAPEIRDAIASPMSDALMAAYRPLLQALRADPERSRGDLSAYQWIFEGRPLGWDRAPTAGRISFVACVNDETQFGENLAASPCFQGPDPQELIVVRGAPSAAEGLAAGLGRARHDLVVLVHQDVYLPEGWVARFFQQWGQAQEAFGDIGVAGVYGVSHASDAPDGILRFGHVVDRQHLLWEKPDLPAPVESLDEVVLAVNKRSGLRLDPSLGFHLYGSDLALQARQAGLAAVVLDAPCFHNSRTTARLPESFHQSAAFLRQKWAGSLPLATSCALFQ